MGERTRERICCAVALQRVRSLLRLLVDWIRLSLAEHSWARLEAKRSEAGFALSLSLSQWDILQLTHSQLFESSLNSFCMFYFRFVFIFLFFLCFWKCWTSLMLTQLVNAQSPRQRQRRRRHFRLKKLAHSFGHVRNALRDVFFFKVSASSWGKKQIAANETSTAAIMRRMWKGEEGGRRLCDKLGLRFMGSERQTEGKHAQSLETFELFISEKKHTIWRGKEQKERNEKKKKNRKKNRKN